MSRSPLLGAYSSIKEGGNKRGNRHVKEAKERNKWYVKVVVKMSRSPHCSAASSSVRGEMSNRTRSGNYHPDEIPKGGGEDEEIATLLHGLLLGQAACCDLR